MVIGSLFSFLSPTASGKREDDDNPRALFARADLRAINRQRRQLISNFGFEDTITDSPDRVVPPTPGADLAAKGRKTLLGGRKDVK